MKDDGSSEVLFQGYFPAAQGTLYLMPTTLGNGRVEIDAIWLCNTGAAAISTTLLFGKGVLGKVNSLMWQAPLESRRTYIIFGGQPVSLRAGSKFEGLAGTGDEVVMTIFGRIITP
jgi:hypothetical protein